jgi:hypothetical protein
VLKSSVDNRIILSVRLVKTKFNPLDIHNIGVFVLKPIEDEKYIVIYEKVHKCYSPVGLVSEYVFFINFSEIDIPYHAEGYMIVCVIFDKNEGVYLKFELDIQSKLKLDSVKPNSSLYNNLKKKNFEIYGK